jgi:Tat protein secretion system quality control protein TatD with DNase activity
LTFALKHKLKTASKAFDRFGRYLEDPETGIVIYHEEAMKVKHEYKISAGSESGLDKKLLGSPHGTLTKKILNAQCAVCGSTKKVEMHHVRKASDIRSKIRTGNSSYLQ